MQCQRIKACPIDIIVSASLGTGQHDKTTADLDPLNPDGSDNASKFAEHARFDKYPDKLFIGPRRDKRNKS
ncbi:hypothetical protein [Commensalibacter melissae]|uniref:Uncharacterized protein n=1 Tax=Commensalibacter melissae TaxID=2070537 RepID=A0A318MZH9_9PROT|nr:hypothetical protein [Commensalibacter melissae]PXZ02060.1 hypothetical protein DK869_03440 [Commensalibacter melissae]